MTAKQNRKRKLKSTPAKNSNRDSMPKARILPINRNISPQKAIQVLAKSGMVVDEKEASEILDLMYFLAKLIVNKNFRK